MNLPENDHILAPPPALLTRNPLRWLQFFGPGAVIASLNIGTGEILFPSRIGAMFGYELLWMFLVASVLKWVLAYSAMRHMVLSGAHPLERWGEIPGPRGWLPLFVITITVLLTPVGSFFMQGVLASICAWIFGVGTIGVWATISVAVTVVLLAIGRYKFLERFQLVVLGLMLVCIAISVVYVRPDYLAALEGLFAPRLPDYPDWVFAKYPKFQDRSVWVELSLAAALTGGLGYDYLCYVSLLRDKRWGNANQGIASTKTLDEIAEKKNHPARLWVRAALIDSVMSFVMVVAVIFCFSVLAAEILQPERLVPEDQQLFNHQARFLTNLSWVLLPLYQLAVFLAFLGSLYGGPEMAYRIYWEYFRTLPAWRNAASTSWFRWAVSGWVLGGGLAIVWYKEANPETTIVQMFTVPGIYTGLLLACFFCFANAWSDWRFLPPRLRMSKALFVLNVVGGLVFGAVGIKALWDESPWHLAIFPALLVATMFVARRIPSTAGQSTPES